MPRKETITIAFVGPYSLLPGLTFNDSQVVGGFDQIDVSAFGDASSLSLGAWFFWNDFAAAIAVDEINQAENVLSGVTIEIKRFSSYYPYGKKPKTRIRAYAGGQAIATAYEIATEHPDVVAVFGEFFSATTKFSAQVYGQYQLPFCGATQTSRTLLDKNNYPYYVQTISLTGNAETKSLAFRNWGVRRVAIVSDESLLLSSESVCVEAIKSFTKFGIEIAATIPTVTDADVDYITESLARSDARKNQFVGDRYVWFTENQIYPPDNQTLYGTDYFRKARGVMSDYIGNFGLPGGSPIDVMDDFFNRFRLKQQQWG
ncbi:periplasmic binding protein-like I [Chytriomyces sp. MP71]|nr:periplasmic binding protein-like I [Chytriomyces sp. MP71]